MTIQCLWIVIVYQYCQCLWIVFVPCVSNTVSVSGLSLSCVLCVQRQSRNTGNIWIVFDTVSCVPNTVSLWIVFVLCLGTNTVSVSGLSLSLCNIGYTRHSQCLWTIQSCVLGVQYCQFLWIVFVLCLGCPILSGLWIVSSPVSLCAPILSGLWIVQSCVIGTQDTTGNIGYTRHRTKTIQSCVLVHQYCQVSGQSLSCVLVSNTVSFSGLSLSCVNPILSVSLEHCPVSPNTVSFSLTLSCVNPNTVSFSGLSLSCVNVQYCQFLWIVFGVTHDQYCHLWITLSIVLVPNTVSFSGLSLSCVMPNTVSFSGLSSPGQCPILSVSLNCPEILSVSLDCLCPVSCMSHTVSVSGLSLSCVLCQYCQ